MSVLSSPIQGPALVFSPELLLHAQGIKVAFFDVDGVLTDGGLYFSEYPHGHERAETLGGFRASGGPVTGGTSYIVGERGPELFTPNTSGAIVPNGALGGAKVSIVVNNNAGPDTRASATATTDSTGNTQIMVMVEKIEGMMGRRIGQGGGLAPMLEGRYGLNPAAGARR